MDYYFTSTLGCYSELMHDKCVAKASQNWRHKTCLVNYTTFSLQQWNIFHLRCWSWLKGGMSQRHV
jgi:hypothetical protein